MGNKESTPLDQFFDRTERYDAKSEAEGKVIVAACLAAAKVFSPPVYRCHRAFPIEAIIGEHFIPLERIREAMKAETTEEVISKLPEDTSFFWMFIVMFKSFYEDILIQLEGKLEEREIRWKIKSVVAVGSPELLTEEELSRFS